MIDDSTVALPVDESEGTADEAGGEPDGGADGLTTLERDVLVFEAAHLRHSTVKADAIRARFGRSSAQYYQILATLIEAPAAIAFDPLLTSRLRRLRDARAAQREARRVQRRSSAVPGRRSTHATQTALVDADPGRRRQAR